MASSKPLFFLVSLSSFAIFQMASASDIEITSDFIIPSDLKGEVDGSFFTFTGMRALVGAEQLAGFKSSKAGMVEFPALNGLGVSLAFLQFPAGTINPPHSHPRSAELLFVVDGSLEVGLVDSKNKLYKQTLQTNDIFVFPKGLIHYQNNPDAKKPAIALSSFGSANPGTISLPLSLFTSGIDDGILSKAFKIDDITTQALKTAFAPKT
ncbi:hypothetical protein ACOSQ4_016167 [Xanthoceras sorbifolium]